MSTVVYGLLTADRQKKGAVPSKIFKVNSVETAATGSNDATTTMRGYLDQVAALVPAEVLALHALILSFTTRTEKDANGVVTTSISAPAALQLTGIGCLAICAILYISANTSGRKVDLKSWKWVDFVRMLIGPFAFVCWTALQKLTAFDAFFPDIGWEIRTVAALLGAAGLAALTHFLTPKPESDQKAQ